MKLFISWSGTRSQHAAEALHDWLKLVVHGLDPWLSSSDISPGQRWRDSLGSELLESQFGIFCVTPENRSAPWLLFEAGAISKSHSSARVVPLLIDIDSSELVGPLGQFQSLTADRTGIRTLVTWLFDSAATSLQTAEIDRIFDRMWPELEERLGRMPEVTERVPGDPRTDRELLLEMLTVLESSRSAVSAEQISDTLRHQIVDVTAEVERMEAHAKSIDNPREAASFRSWSLAREENRLARLKSALRALTDPYAARASTIAITWFDDLIRAVAALQEDLETREYRIEADSAMRGEERGPTYARVQREMRMTATLLAHLKSISENAEGAQGR